MSDDSGKLREALEKEAESKRNESRLLREQQAFDRLEKRRKDAIEKIQKKWDEFNDKMSAIKKSTTKQEKADLEKELQSFMADIKTESEILSGQISELTQSPHNKESAVIRQRIDILQDFLRECDLIHQEVKAKADNLALALGKKKSVKPRTEAQQFEKALKKLDKFESNYEKFEKKNASFRISEYFGLRKINMKMEDLEKLSRKIERYSQKHAEYLKHILRHAASQKRMKMEDLEKNLYEPKNPQDQTSVVIVNPENQAKFPPETWDAIVKLSTLAISLNGMNTRIQLQKSHVQDDSKKLDEIATQIKAAEKANQENLQQKRKTLEAQIQQEQEELYSRNVENVASLADNRLLYAPLTPAEAEKIRRKQAFLNELRIQQSLANAMGLHYDFGKNVLNLCNMGSLKVTQFSAAAWEGAKEVMDELSAQALHSIDMTLAAPIAISVKATNAGFMGLGRAFGYLAAYGFEGPRDTLVKGFENYGKLSTIEKVKFWGSAITSPVWFPVGGLFRGIGKVSDAVQKGLNYDRWAKNSRGFTTAAGTVGGLVMLALVIAAPFTLGLSLIPLGAVGIGLGVSTAYSAKRAITNAAKAAKEVTSLRLSEEDSIRLAMFDYDNPRRAASDKAVVRQAAAEPAPSSAIVVASTADKPVTLSAARRFLNWFKPSQAPKTAVRVVTAEAEQKRKGESLSSAGLSSQGLGQAFAESRQALAAQLEKTRTAEVQVKTLDASPVVTQKGLKPGSGVEAGQSAETKADHDHEPKPTHPTDSQSKPRSSSKS